ncbi:glycosyltransferase family 4 protein [Algivirga pacifica]|uniref:Glycosyltransferase subfamily 4-like N-terminal domain-containing protein n=1 Tax=Algivirga pacifica TaxID=1162670 RepID=A0ABP9D942_9BACT
MRLLWLTENYPPLRGGMAQSCDRIVYGLRNKGLQVDVVHLTERVREVTTEQQQGGKLIEVPVYESEAHTLQRLWNVLEKEKGGVEAVVAFGGYLPMLGGPVLSSWLQAPLVTMVRGNDFDVAVFSPRRRKVLEDAMNKSSFVASVSKDKAERIQAFFPEAHVVYTPNGIDVEEWQPTPFEFERALDWKRGIVNNKLCLGIVGHLKAKKGLPLLINALNTPNLRSRFHLLLVGELGEAEQILLEKAEVAYSCYDFLDRYELLAYYPRMDALMIPSFYEGMPNVMLEAGALGVPVIASDIDGMRDVLEHEKDGLLFEAGNITELRDRLFRFDELSQEGRQQLGEQLKYKITTAYTTVQEVDNYLHYFNDLKVTP